MNLQKVLACPACRKKLVEKGKGLQCNNCKKGYGVDRGVPLLIREVLKGEDQAVGSLRVGRWGKVLRDLFGAPQANLVRKPRIFGELIEGSKLTLNIGSSSEKKYERTVNLDLGAFPGVDVVGDGKKLPFKDRSFDLVLLESVLEHVDAPEEVLAEASRVLKKGGKIYVSIPFMFVFHGSPNDFGRLTREGLRARLERAGFSVRDGGLLSGPGSTLSQTLRYFFATLLCFGSQTLYSVWLHVFGWLTFWIRYFDLVLSGLGNAHVMGNVGYVVGVKK